MATTYEPIATTTLGSAAASTTFSSISGAYTDLVLVCDTAPSLNNYGVYMYFNGNTSAIYSATELRGNGSAAASSRWANIVGTSNWIGGQILGMTNTLGNNALVVQIMNYANSTTYKSYISRSNTASIGVEVSVGLYSSTAAITSITVGSQSGSNLVSGSTFTLYGIKAA